MAIKLEFGSPKLDFLLSVAATYLPKDHEKWVTKLIPMDSQKYRLILNFYKENLALVWRVFIDNQFISGLFITSYIKTRIYN